MGEAVPGSPRVSALARRGCREGSQESNPDESLQRPRCPRLAAAYGSSADISRRRRAPRVAGAQRRPAARPQDDAPMLRGPPRNAIRAGIHGRRRDHLRDDLPVGPGATLRSRQLRRRQPVPRLHARGTVAGRGSGPPGRCGLTVGDARPRGGRDWISRSPTTESRRHPPRRAGAALPRHAVVRRPTAPPQTRPRLRLEAPDSEETADRSASRDRLGEFPRDIDRVFCQCFNSRACSTSRSSTIRPPR